MRSLILGLTLTLFSCSNQMQKIKGGKTIKTTKQTHYTITDTGELLQAGNTENTEALIMISAYDMQTGEIRIVKGGRSGFIEYNRIFNNPDYTEYIEMSQKLRTVKVFRSGKVEIWSSPGYNAQCKGQYRNLTILSN